MKQASDTEKRVAGILKQMRKAMPEIKRQVEVYEKNVKSGKQIKYPQSAPQFRNV